jgi:hypothetical protein
MLNLPDFLEVSHTLPHALPLSPTDSLMGQYPVAGATWQYAGQNKLLSRFAWTAIKPYVVTWISTELRIGTPRLPHVSDTFNSHSHTSEILPDHQGILYHSIAFLTLVLRTESSRCLLRPFLPALPRKFRPRMNFQSKTASHMIPRGVTTTRPRDASPLGGRGFLTPLQGRIILTSSQTVRN